MQNQKIGRKNLYDAGKFETSRTRLWILGACHRLGIIFFIMAVIQFMFLVGAETFDIVINIVVPSLTLLFAIYLIVSGLLIRSLKFQTLPISIAIWLVLQIWGVFSSGIGVSTIFTVLLGLMAISGLRGWLWLRKNPFSSEEFS